MKMSVLLIKTFRVLFYIVLFVSNSDGVNIAFIISIFKERKMVCQKLDKTHS